MDSLIHFECHWLESLDTFTSLAPHLFRLVSLGKLHA